MMPSVPPNAVAPTSSSPLRLCSSVSRSHRLISGLLSHVVSPVAIGFPPYAEPAYEARVYHDVGAHISKRALGHHAPSRRGERKIVQPDVGAVITVLLQVVETLSGRLRERQFEQPAAVKRLRMRVVTGGKHQVRCRRGRRPSRNYSAGMR